MKAQLSQHEYPRHIEFLTELPKTQAGKINRQALRDRVRMSANAPMRTANGPCQTGEGARAC
jgi:acetyl-CoA synthetase